MYRLMGTLLGSVTSAALMYYYVIDEYRVSNELLTEDIYVRSRFPPRISVILGYALTMIRRSKQLSNG